MEFIKIHLRGSSLVEILIAMTLLCITISLASIIFLNIQHSGKPFRMVKAEEIGEELIRRTQIEHTIYDNYSKTDGFSVVKKITNHPLMPDCKIVRIVVFDISNEKLYEIESIIHVDI